ncbi:MAG TPA: hypothetical protein VGN77_08215 [Steroidobacteraceae bacterium]|nr:hypothetical protein [Steroidobacteraceae bacterium]
MWRNIRLTILVGILFFVALGSWLDQHRSTSWENTVRVGAFPVTGDASAVAASYVAALNVGQLQPVSEFIAREAHRYGVPIEEPIHMALYPALASAPPVLDNRAGIFARLLWSLRLRYYRYNSTGTVSRSRPQIALFLVYHDPALTPVLPHSVGLQRGLTGVVHLFATPSQDGQNAIVTAHELLHTFGATDKYADGGTPLYPSGYAEPLRVPRFPQRYAEIMAGRVPLNADRQEMPDDLSQTLVGPTTAREIGWIKH